MPFWESQFTSPPQDALQYCADLWTCCGGSSDSNLVLLCVPACSCVNLCVLASYVDSYQKLCFLLWELSMSFYIFHRHRVCLVDCVDLICSLYSWQEDFGSSWLATLPRGFNYVSFSTSACGLSTGVFSRGCLGGLGFAPVRARCGGGAAAWVAWVLAEPGTQGSWGLGKQDIY